MNKSDIKILIDVDDTIEDLIPAWVNWLNNSHDLNVNPDSIDCWEMYKHFPTLAKFQVYEPLYLNEFWETVMPKADAVYYVNSLYLEGYDLYLCTNSNLETIMRKRENIIDVYFPYLKDKIIIISNNPMLNADFLIDDNPKNLIGGSYNKILFSCSHNKNLCEDDKKKMYLITNSWKRIYETIEGYANISWNKK